MWAQIISAVLGIWMMAAPSVLSYTTTTAEVSDRIVGPVVATFAIVACWQAMRGVRLFNLPLGLWLVAAPWVLDYAFAAATWNSTLVGAAITGLALVQGKIDQRFGGGWRALFGSGHLHQREAAEGAERPG